MTRRPAADSSLPASTRPMGRTRWFLMALAGMVISAVCGAYLHRQHVQERDAAFQLAGVNFTRKLEQRIAFLSHEVEKLAFMISLGGLRNPHEFQAYVKYVFDFEQGIQALEWVPSVTAAQRDSFESMAASMTPQYRIQDYSPGGLLPAGRRAQYFPILLAAPVDANRAVLGLDLGSEPLRRDTLERAMRTGRIAVSAPIRLIQNAQHHSGLLLAAPVYRNGNIAQPVAEGLAVAVLSVADYLGSALAQPEFTGMNVAIFDRTAGMVPTRLAGTSPPASTSNTSNSYTAPVPFGDRKWQVEISRVSQSLWNEAPAHAMIAMGLGTGLSAIMLFFGLRSQGRERDLHLLEAQFQAILDNSPAIIFAKDLDGRYLAVNRAAGRFSLTRPQDMLGRTDAEAYPRSMATQFRENDRIVHQSGRSEYFEERVFDHEGTERQLLVVKFPIKDYVGTTVALGGIATDITDRKQMEAELHEKERMFRTFTDHLPMVFWMTSPDERKVLFVSAAYDALFLRRREDLYDDPHAWRAWISPDDSERLARTAGTHPRTESFSEEFRILRPDGSKRWIHNRIVPVCNERGQVYLRVGMMQDITERKTMERVWEGFVEAATVSDGAEYFQILARYLADVLGTRTVLISEVPAGAKLRLRDIACWPQGSIPLQSARDVSGTPCEQVLTQATRTYPANVQQAFPDFPELARCGAESYSGAPMFNRHGHCVGLIAVMDDKPISDVDFVENILAMVAARASVELDRVRTQRNLQLSEARFAGIINSAMDAIITLNGDLHVVLFNTAAERIFGCRAAEALGQTLDAFLPIPAREQHAQHIRQFGRNGSTPQPMSPGRIVHAIRRDGTRFPIQASISQSEVEKEKFYTVILRDVTEQVESEKLLQEWGKRYQAAIDASGQLLYDWKIESNQVVYGGDTARILGYTPDELRGSSRRWFEIVHPDDRIAFKAEVARALRKLDTFNLSYRLLHRNGSVIYCEDIGHFVYDSDGAPDRLVGFVSDVTQRKHAESELRKMEEQVRQSQKMEALGHLTGGIAHDFNNILASIIGYAGLVKNQPAARDDDKTRQYLHELVHGAERARDLVGQMLAFGRKSPGKPKIIPVQSMLEETARMMMASIPATVRIKVAAGAGPHFVEIDPVHLQQVLLNLCINARDAMDNRGDISIASAHIHMHGDKQCASCHATIEGAYVEICVHDNGTGIDPALISRIFEPFFTTKPPGKGSGMGLAVVHGIVHERDGHILIDSTPQGTTVRILLPVMQAARADVVDQPASVVSPLHPRRMNIVLVDDETMITGYLCELLRGEGHEVVAFNDPLQALAWLESPDHIVDMLLTDRTMAGMTGIELAQSVHHSRPELPIIMLSGFVNDDDTHHGAIRRVCKKPIDNAELLRVLDEEMNARD